MTRWLGLTMGIQTASCAIDCEQNQVGKKSGSRANAELIDRIDQAGWQSLHPFTTVNCSEAKSRRSHQQRISQHTEVQSLEAPSVGVADDR